MTSSLLMPERLSGGDYLHFTPPMPMYGGVVALKERPDARELARPVSNEAHRKHLGVRQGLQSGCFPVA